MFKLRIIVFFVVFSFLFSTVAFTETATKEVAKKVDVSATLDVGNNTKELLQQGGSAVTKIIEQLAKSLGMTVEKIFPYYVKQAYLNGLMSMLVWSGFEIVCLILTGILLKLSFVYKEKEVKNASDNCDFLAVVVFVFFGVGFIFGVFYLSDWITLMKNPEYTAIHTLIKDAYMLTK